MENALLLKITEVVEALSLPLPLDVRKTLPVNASGRIFRLREVAKLKGLVAHQELGWMSIVDTARYHISPKCHVAPGQGMESLLYSMAIDEKGIIHICNDFNKATWSQGDRNRAGDENAEFLAVMFVGNFNGEGHSGTKRAEPNHAQLLSFMILWQACKDLWGWSDKDLYGHYHFGKKACPGNTLKTIIESVRR